MWRSFRSYTTSTGGVTWKLGPGLWLAIFGVFESKSSSNKLRTVSWITLECAMFYYSITLILHTYLYCVCNRHKTNHSNKKTKPERRLKCYRFHFIASSISQVVAPQQLTQFHKCILCFWLCVDTNTCIVCNMLFITRITLIF